MIARYLVPCAAAVALACSSGNQDGQTPTGGAAGFAGYSGGASSNGGTAVNMAGQATSTGGTLVGAGGTPGGGGTIVSSGGVSSSGGVVSVGGAQAAGGTPGTGGAGGGGAGGEGGTSGAGGMPPGTPGTFKLFDHIPQFGMYATSDPAYTPPAGVLMWNVGTVFVVRLADAQKAQIGSDLAARVTYHAQCDNYDRLGLVFFLTTAKGETPKPADPRTEIVRFVTPFSDYNRGTLATHVYPNADISTFATTLADPSRDVWVGIAGGSNPYDGDPCTNAGVAADFKSIGFKYSLDFISTKPLAAAPGVTLTAIANVSATSVPVKGTFTHAGASAIDGHVIVIVSGHGSDSGGHEYRSTQDTVTLNGKQIGSFDTRIDCAEYEKFSPDGNPGIFRNNTSSNPRNWCPGALVPSHVFSASLMPGANAVSMGVNVSSVPSGSYYATSILFASP
jgi:hypothetical protein